MRSLDELTSVADPAWPLVLRWASAGGDVTILPRHADASERCLRRLQVTTRSVLGALAYECGGVLVDHGWLRLLGGGPQLVDVASASGLEEPTSASSPPSFLVVGFDVLGGRFAVNGGGLAGASGEVCFYAPDTLAWEPLGMGHGDFVEWALTADLGAFYRDLRWPGWEQETQALQPDQGLSVYPPLFTAEARGDVAGTSRRPVPFTELLDLQSEVAAQLEQVPDGRQLQIRTE